MNYEYLARTIDQCPEIIEGLKSGKMTLEGGVIRIAKGNEGAGQIVRHLKFPNDPSQSLDNLSDVLNQGLGQISQNLGALKNLQYANLALSGLNLVVSVAGFVVMNKKLNTITSILNENSDKFDSLTRAVNEINARNMIQDNAEFMATISTAEQFMVGGDTEHLKPLISPIKQQYIYSRDILKKTLRATPKGQFSEYSNYIFALRDRVVNSGLCLANVQNQSGYKIEAIQALQQLKGDWYSINQEMYNMSLEKNLLDCINKNDFIDLKKFMNLRAETIPLLDYQANLIQLSHIKPELTEIINEDTKELLLIAA